MAAPRRKKPVNAGYLTKAPSEVHNGFAAYIAETTGTEVPAETVGLVQRLYPLYLKSPAVVAAREAAKAEKEAEARRKAEEKARRVRERLARIEAQRAKLLADLGIEDTDAEVIEAADRFTDDKGIEFAVSEPDAEPEDDFEETDDDEPQAAEVTVEDDEDEDDLWDDEDDDEDEEDF